MRTWRHIALLPVCLVVALGLALGSDALAGAQDREPGNGIGAVAYKGTVGLKEPEGFAACNFTGDFAFLESDPPVANLRISVAGSIVTLSFKGGDRGVRSDLSCPSQGWSGDLHWTANYGYHHQWPGNHDGSGAVDEIIVKGPLVASFTYEWRNCSGPCPAKKEVERRVGATFYGQFQDNAQTIINGTVIDQNNVFWGRWSAAASSGIAVAHVIQPDVLNNGVVIEEPYALQPQDVLSLRYNESGRTPRAKVVCGIGGQEGQSIEFTYLLSDSLVSLINPGDDWDSSPQMLADWQAFCINEPRAADASDFGIELLSGAVAIAVEATALPSSFETGTLTVHTTTANSFAIGYSPETNKTIVAAYSGALELVPVNEQLDPFTLEPGQVVVVDADKIEPAAELARLVLPVVVGP